MEGLKDKADRGKVPSTGLGGTRHKDRPQGWGPDGLCLVSACLRLLICGGEIIKDTSKDHCEAEDKCPRGGS